MYAVNLAVGSLVHQIAKVEKNKDEKKMQDNT